MTSDATAFLAAGSGTQPQRLVIGEGDSVDEASASGAWLAIDADHVAEVRP